MIGCPPLHQSTRVKVYIRCGWLPASGMIPLVTCNYSWRHFHFFWSYRILYLVQCADSASQLTILTVDYRRERVPSTSIKTTIIVRVYIFSYKSMIDNIIKTKWFHHYHCCRAYANMDIITRSSAFPCCMVFLFYYVAYIDGIHRHSVKYLGPH